MDEYVSYRDPARARICEWDFGASLLSSIGNWFGYSGGTTAAVQELGQGLAVAEEAGSTIGAAEAAGAAGGITAKELLGYGATGLQLAGIAAQTGATASQAEEQARLGEAQATQIETEAEITRRAQRLQNRQLLSRNRAMAAASGVDPFSGSPLEMELANAFQGSMNEQLTGYGAQLKATNARLGAAFTRRTIPGIYAGGALQAGASALGNMYRMSNPRYTSGGLYSA